MSKIEWTTSDTIDIGRLRIPCAPGLKIEFGPAAGWNQVSGVRTDPPGRRFLKSVAWPITNLANDLWGNGYCHRGVGRWIREATGNDTVFLEVGCGPMSLREYLPRNLWYNGLDIAFSEFQLYRMARTPRTNVVLADAREIPVPSDSVSLIGSCQAFMHFADFESAAKELHRISKPGGRLACSIGNFHCRKYAVRGPNTDIRQRWTYDGFVTLMDRHGFRLLDRKMLGRWVPLPKWLGGDKELPIASPAEVDNSNFLYLFEVVK